MKRKITCPSSSCRRYRTILQLHVRIIPLHTAKRFYTTVYIMELTLDICKLVDVSLRNLPARGWRTTPRLQTACSFESAHLVRLNQNGTRNGASKTFPRDLFVYFLRFCQNNSKIMHVTRLILERGRGRERENTFIFMYNFNAILTEKNCKVFLSNAQDKKKRKILWLSSPLPTVDYFLYLRVITRDSFIITDISPGIVSCRIIQRTNPNWRPAF